MTPGLKLNCHYYKMGNSPIYRAPAYIQLAAKRKTNKEDIFVVGVKDKKLQEFKKNINYHGVKIHRPEPKGRAVVAIDTRCHANTAKFEASSDALNMEGSEAPNVGIEKPDDWYDEFEITSRKDEGKENKKSFQLQLQSSTTKGGSFNVQLTGGGFFNAVAAPSANIGGSYQKTKTKTVTNETSATESLSRGYEIKDILKVPPKTKVKAKITTWAVTYESKVITEVTVDAKAYVTIFYRPMWSRVLFGGAWKRKVRITAKELFCDELEYECKDDRVTFKRVGAISHLGEEVEILKERDPCTLEEELNCESVPITV